MPASLAPHAHNRWDDARRYLSTILQEASIVELRAFEMNGPRKTVWSGYFSDPAVLIKAIESIEDRCEGVYVTFNPLHDAIFSRRANRIKAVSDRDPSTADLDVARRAWLAIDIDPQRPSGVSATDDEHEAAHLLARRIMRDLCDLGWPEPILIDSGNGAHLYYKISMRNSSDSTKLVQTILKTLDVMFGGGSCHVDKTVYNAARIMRLPGTWARKGDSTPDRPHRVSRLLSVPEELKVVSEQVQKKLIAFLPRTDSDPPVRAHMRAGWVENLAQWLSLHGIGFESRTWNGGTLYRLDECPYSGGHKDGAYVIQFPNGAIHAGCHHNSCGGGRQRWKELRERYDGVVQNTNDAVVADDPLAGLVRIGDRGRINLEHGAIASYLHRKFHTLSFNKQIWIYDQVYGVYRVDGGEVAEEIQEIIIRVGFSGSITKEARDIYFILLTVNRKNDYPFNHYPDLIPLNNGILKMDFEAGTSDLIPHSPQYLFTYKISAKYDPNVQTDKARDLLGEWVEPDDAPLLVQIAAQAILQAQLQVSYKKNYIVQGEPHAGKSTYIEFLIRFFGDELVSHKSLQSVCNDRFVAADLESKLLNAFDDLQEIPLESVSNFKAVTGTCKHGIERKFQQSYPGVITCPHIFSCNRPPKYPDDVKYDAAWWERWEYVRFPFSYSIDDSFITRTFSDEMYSSYLNLVVAAMVMIRRDHRLGVNRDASEVMERWSMESDPLCQFIRCKMTESAKASDITAFDRQKLFEQYLKFCNEENIDPRKRIATQAKFTRYVQGYKLTPSKTTRRIEKRRYTVDVYQGPYRWNGDQSAVTPEVRGNVTASTATFPLYNAGEGREKADRVEGLFVYSRGCCVA
jgi:phage/plasmid-associated DNA primase